eukprot:TRINITY_DN57_c0_g1_i1.p1 TRINITY_DN57_c0_g1~~TRINITY_DN57_c0_g1_i1.p1  ORF type:complete len:182 (+),score=20.77 TRINITY_DN57_c0_g1_i1:183-728(+)
MCAKRAKSWALGGWEMSGPSTLAFRLKVATAAPPALLGGTPPGEIPRDGGPLEGEIPRGGGPLVGGPLEGEIPRGGGPLVGGPLPGDPPLRGGGPLVGGPLPGDIPRGCPVPGDADLCTLLGGGPLPGDLPLAGGPLPLIGGPLLATGPRGGLLLGAPKNMALSHTPVSYTHLTLPTNREV